MLMSIILIGNQTKGEFERSLRSIFAQSDNDYEIIICADISADNSELSDFYRNSYFKYPEINTVIFNKTPVGNSTNWNNALDVSRGDYITFLKSGDTLDANYISYIKDVLKKNVGKKLDIIEFTANLTGLARTQVNPFLVKNKIYNLEKEFEPFAYISDFLFNKCYRRDVIEKNSFTFKPFADYDMFFIYKFLTQAKNYIFIDTKEIGYVDIQISNSDHSVFDSVNQWTHILNYFRRLGRFKELKDYLIYAYIKLIVQTWASEIKLYKNRVLIEKVYEFVVRKITHKRKTEFVKNNIAFKNSKDEKFKSLILNFENYIEDFRKIN